MELVEKVPAPQSAPAIPSRKSNCFDAIRLFAALSVVVWHTTRHTGMPFLWVHSGTAAWFFDGVPLFFVMSGMLVYRSCYRCIEEGRPVYQFYVNRFLRVGPALYVYATLTPIFLLAIGAIGLKLILSLPFVEWYLSNLAFCPVKESIFHWSTVQQLNGSLWTIPVEVSFYVFCPVLVLIERKFGLKALLGTLLGLSALGLAMTWHFEGNPPVPDIWWRTDGPQNAAKIYLVTYLTFLPHFMFFSAGILWLRLWDKVSHSGWLALACVAIYILLRYEIVPLARVLGPLDTIVWGIPFSYFAVWIGYYAPAWAAKITSFGDISYGVYIWHMVVVNTFIYFALPSQIGQPIVVHLCIYGCAILVAYGSWKLVEQPCLKLKPFTARGKETRAW